MEHVQRLGQQPEIDPRLRHQHRDDLHGLLRRGTESPRVLHRQVGRRCQSRRPLKKAELKIYDQGLGVTSNGECLCSPEHALDNVGKNELIVFQLPSDNWDPQSVTLVPYGDPLDTDVTFLIGGTLAQFPNLASFENMSINDLLNAGFTEYTSTTSTNGTRTVSIPGDATGRYLIVASWLNDTKPNDDFKIKTIASKPGTTTQVSEPATMALLTFGLCAFAAYRRRTHYGGA